MIDESLIKILICPACKGDIMLKEQEIACTDCGRRYPIQNGVPVMLIGEAEGGKKIAKAEGRHVKNSGHTRSKSRSLG